MTSAVGVSQTGPAELLSHRRIQVGNHPFRDEEIVFPVSDDDRLAPCFDQGAV